MKQRSFSFVLLAVLACPMFVGAGLAQQTVPIWNGTFTDQHNSNNYNFTMVGSDPSSGGSTNVNVYLIPLELVFSGSTCASGQTVFDPTTPVYGTETAVDNLQSSPIFTAIPGFNESNGTSMQYLDAFQRGTFWGVVTNEPSYHVTLTVQQPVMGKQTLSVTGAANGTAMDDPNHVVGGCVGVVDPTWFDAQLVDMVQSWYLSNQISPTGLAMFVLYDAFYGQYFPQGWEIEGAGVHGATLTPDGAGIQTYVSATYNSYDENTCSYMGQPATCQYQDVDDFSHETAEWMDDPFGHTPGPCNGYLEVGDPLVPYGTSAYHSYTGLNGFSFHLQDLVFLKYFGAGAPYTSYGNQFTFQGVLPLSYCSDGQ